jgi:hypothetical protein
VALSFASPEVLQRSLEEAGLAEWLEKLRPKIEPHIETIYQSYWSNLIDDFSNDLWITRKAKNIYTDMSTPTFFQRIVTRFSVVGAQWLTKSVAKKVAANVAAKPDAEFMRIMVALGATMRYLLTVAIDPSDLVDVRQILLDPRIGLDLSTASETIQRLFDTGFQLYFPTVNLDLKVRFYLTLSNNCFFLPNFNGLMVKGRMVGRVLSLSAEDLADPVHMVKAVMMGAGPAMQKLMQLIVSSITFDLFGQRSLLIPVGK